MSSRDTIRRAEILLDGFTAHRSSESEESNQQLPQHVWLGCAAELAGISEQQRKFTVVRMFLWTLFGAATSVAAASVIPAIIGGTFALVERWYLSFAAQRRATEFERDYTAMLLSLASAIRTGLDPLAALMGLERLFATESQVAQGLKKFRNGVERGETEEKVFRSFARSINHPDVKLFTTACILSRREGSSLAECLQRLARVTRQRQSFRRKIRSALAMQKLSTIGIAICAVVIGVIQFASNPKAIDMAISHPVGSKILGLGGCLILLGIGWMFRLSSQKV